MHMHVKCEEMGRAVKVKILCKNKIMIIKKKPSTNRFVDGFCYVSIKYGVSYTMDFSFHFPLCHLRNMAIALVISSKAKAIYAPITKRLR